MIIMITILLLTPKHIIVIHIIIPYLYIIHLSYTLLSHLYTYTLPMLISYIVITPKQTLNSKGWEFSCPLNFIVSLPEV